MDAMRLMPSCPFRLVVFCIHQLTNIYDFFSGIRPAQKGSNFLEKGPRGETVRLTAISVDALTCQQLSRDIPRT